MRRTERLFAIAEYLRGRRTGVTAEQLAERFSVGIRTVYRDLDALREATLPVEAERGRGGGYALDRAYALPPVNFTPHEAALLVASGRWLVEMRIVPFVETLARAIDKVRGALSVSAQRRLLERMSELQFVGVPAHKCEPKVLLAIEEAWLDGSEVVITYVGADYVETTRRVKIRSILLERGETRLNCLDLEKDAERQFRLDRITRAKVQRPA